MESDLPILANKRKTFFLFWVAQLDFFTKLLMSSVCPNSFCKDGISVRGVASHSVQKLLLIRILLRKLSVHPLICILSRDVKEFAAQAEQDYLLASVIVSLV